MKKDKTDDSKFIPTIKQWDSFYRKWSEKMAKSLWRNGSERDCEEAVHLAFLKVLGLAQNLKLEKELTPKAEGQWYCFLRGQARGILSNMNKTASRFAEVKKDYFEGRCDNLIDEPYTVLDVEREDREQLRRDIRSFVKHACDRKHISDARFRAFAMFVLDEEDGDAVVAAIPEIRNTNNLYQAKSCIIDAIKACAEEEGNPFEDLLAA